MTQETKLGSLIGLGLIAVFAVLLSHSASPPLLTQKSAPVTSNLGNSARPVSPDELRGAPPSAPGSNEKSDKDSAMAKLPEGHVQIPWPTTRPTNPSTTPPPTPPVDQPAGRDLPEVPGIARIAGVAVGQSTVEDLEHALGPGLPYTGGHPNGAREWRVRQPDCYIQADGFENNGRSRMIDSVTITTRSATGDPKVPWVSLPRGRLRFMGAVELEMKRSQVLAALKGKLPPPQASGQDLIWTAKRAVRVNQDKANDLDAWSARLRFRRDRLVEIRIANWIDQHPGSQRTGTNH